MSAARSEHEVSEIIDGLSEQEVRPGSPSSPPSPLVPLQGSQENGKRRGLVPWLACGEVFLFHFVLNGLCSLTLGNPME